MQKDILLDSNGDIHVSDTADISLRNSIRQDVKIRLQWFFEEWKFAPEAGVPYFESFFVKNPSTDAIKQIIRDEAGKAEGVQEVKNVLVEIDNATRNAEIRFTLVTDYGEYREELTINV